MGHTRIRNIFTQLYYNLINVAIAIRVVLPSFHKRRGSTIIKNTRYRNFGTHIPY